MTCPYGQGVLSEVRGSRPLRFRCQIGHAYSAEAVATHIEEVDDAIRVVMRVMEERVTLVERMARDLVDLKTLIKLMNVLCYCCVAVLSSNAAA